MDKILYLVVFDGFRDRYGSEIYLGGIFESEDKAKDYATKIENLCHSVDIIPVKKEPSWKTASDVYLGRLCRMSNFKPVHVVHSRGGQEYIEEEIINFDYVVRICPYYAKNTLGKTQIFFQDQPMWTSTVITEVYTCTSTGQLLEVKDNE
jgi:hypothetical protein